MCIPKTTMNMGWQNKDSKEKMKRKYMSGYLTKALRELKLNKMNNGEKSEE